MRYIAVLRSKGVHLQEIRNTEAWIREQFGVEYPLVSKELWTYGSNVFIQFQDHIIAASRFGHIAMNFIGDWLRRVELDMGFDERNLASSWSPYEDISLNPIIQFGEPCVSDTRIPTRSILNKAKAGDKPEVIAKLYNLDLTKVKHALQWEERLVST
jgi:uncharacterized protein (DUF433 family)